MNWEFILRRKPHNKHYLERYIKLIKYYQNQIHDPDVYLESHHICPKAKDLFPEYHAFKMYPWNKILLPARIHFLCHWLLWKSYGGSQTFAFRCMANKQSNQYQEERKFIKINSSTYEKLKLESYILSSKAQKGLAAYVDAHGNKIRCSTKDKRVLSGELVSTSKGRKNKKRSNEFKRNQSKLLTEACWIRFPVRKAKLFFLDIKTEIEYTEDNFILIDYLDQGWSMKMTPEYRSMLSIKSNKNRDASTRKQAAKSLSLTLKKKKEAGVVMRRKPTKEELKRMRKVKDKDYTILSFNTETQEFLKKDILDIEHPWVEVFGRTSDSRSIYEKTTKKRKTISNIIPTPNGYTDFRHKQKIYRPSLNQIILDDTLEKHDILLSVPNGDRVKVSWFYCNTLTQIYVNKKLLTDYPNIENIQLISDVNTHSIACLDEFFDHTASDNI